MFEELCPTELLGVICTLDKVYGVMRDLTQKKDQGNRFCVRVLFRRYGNRTKFQIICSFWRLLLQAQAQALLPRARPPLTLLSLSPSSSTVSLGPRVFPVCVSSFLHKVILFIPLFRYSLLQIFTFESWFSFIICCCVCPVKKSFDLVFCLVHKIVLVRCREHRHFGFWILIIWFSFLYR